MNGKKEENNGNKKKQKQYPTYPKCDVFIPEILVLDTKSYRKMFKYSYISLDEAIAELSRLNDTKFKQSGGSEKNKKHDT